MNTFSAYSLNLSKYQAKFTNSLASEGNQDTLTEEKYCWPWICNNSLFYLELLKL